MTIMMSSNHSCAITVNEVTTDGILVTRVICNYQCGTYHRPLTVTVRPPPGALDCFSFRPRGLSISTWRKCAIRCETRPYWAIAEVGRGKEIALSSHRERLHDDCYLDRLLLGNDGVLAAAHSKRGKGLAHASVQGLSCEGGLQQPNRQYT